MCSLHLRLLCLRNPSQHPSWACSEEKACGALANWACLSTHQVAFHISKATYQWCLALLFCTFQGWGMGGSSCAFSLGLEFHGHGQSFVARNFVTDTLLTDLPPSSCHLTKERKDHVPAWCPWRRGCSQLQRETEQEKKGKVHHPEGRTSLRVLPPALSSQEHCPKSIDTGDYL